MVNLNKYNLKEGNKVIVDKEHGNGGYEAKVLWIGNIYASIKAGNDVWDIMINRLTPKQDNQ